MVKPEIQSMNTINIIGGLRIIIARVRIGERDTEVTFHGNRNEKPGHVRLIVGNDSEVPVPHPERYGREFNEDWVRTYWDKNTKGTDDDTV